uniref:Lipoprotein n=1 Tax=Streptomyces sp. NBC_00093 TaxID=2975649 RepID=A0AAU1ZZU9_9ACTN
MTSGTYAREFVRRAAGVAAVLVLAGCSGGGGSDAGAASPGSGSAASSASSPSPSSSDSGSGSGGTTADSALVGSWLTTSKGSAVALVVTGAKAGLFATGGMVCSGTAGKETGMQMIRLTCSDGNKDRAEGMVDSVDATSMKVTWESGLGTETYTKAEGGQLPSGLPTAGLGS